MPSLKPRGSIIITTRNRAAHLCETLASFRGVVVPPDLPTELLVVDNCSTDDTAEVIKSTHLPQMPVRYLYEPKPGQSNARNGGMANTTGDVIVFTDDDVRVPAKWLKGMCLPLVADNADLVAGGVVMAPHLERPWMTQRHRNLHGDTSIYTNAHPVAMIGANMAFNRKVLEKVPAFDPDLGPGALGFWDDALFSRQLTNAGFRLAGAFDVQVEHHFDPRRLCRRSFRDRLAREGRSQAYVSYHWKHESFACPWGKTLKMWLKLRRYQLLHAPKWPHGDSGMADEEMAVVQRFHFCREFLRQRQRPRNYERLGCVKLKY
jgi:glycosyltransferase involved in cell wall biosynthesis